MLDEQAVLTALHSSDSALLLTVNQRLAVSWRQRYARYCQSLGQSVWPQQNIQSYTQWLHDCWQRYHVMAGMGDQQLLSVHQERQLWFKAISAVETEWSKTQVATVISGAQDAWHQLVAWQRSVNDIISMGNEDVERFKQWVRRFEQDCQEQGWCAEVQLSQHLADWVANAYLPVPESIQLCGFRTLTPQQQALIEQCVLAGTRVVDDSKTQNEPLAKVRLITYPDSETEWRQTLRNMRQAAQKNPQQMYAAVGLQLEQDRQLVQRLAEEIFADIPYAISGGMPLLQYPLVSAILDWLQLPFAEDYETISRVLLSPWFQQDAAENEQRWRLDLSARACLSPLVNFRQYCRWVNAQTDAPEEWMATLNQAKDWAKQPPCDTLIWAQRLLAQIEASGCLDTLPMSEDEQQVAEKLLTSLSQLSEYQALYPHIDYYQVLQIWRDTLSRSLFQPQAQRVRVWILGPLESEGLAFEQLWLVGANEQVWPMPVRYSPYLPVSQQRQWQMAHAVPERELALAQHQYDTWLGCCQVLTASWTCWDQGMPVSVSALLSQHLPADVFEDSCNSAIATNVVPWVDECGPAVEAEELSQLGGGAYLLKQQALCPFQAFAARRLNLTAFPEVEKFLTTAQRGTLLHDVLERCWKALVTQVALQQLQAEPTTYQDFIHDQVSQCLRHWQRRWPLQLNQAVMSLEQQRLEMLLRTWLDFEAQRVAFEVVAIEQACLTSVADLPLALRVDRIDRLADGKTLVIDYKTGPVSKSSWFGWPLLEPQLPLYALATDVNAVAFARVDAGEQVLVGVGDAVVAQEGISALDETRYADGQGWSAQLQSWSDKLSALATAFLAGEAKVAPVSASACRYCEFRLVCRVSE